jgi:hypothetical protein
MILGLLIALMGIIYLGGRAARHVGDWVLGRYETYRE